MSLREEIRKQLERLKKKKEDKYFPKSLSEEFGEDIELLEKFYRALDK